MTEFNSNCFAFGKNNHSRGNSYSSCSSKEFYFRFKINEANIPLECVVQSNLKKSPSNGLSIVSSDLKFRLSDIF